jgi:hypothetical protein
VTDLLNFLKADWKILLTMAVVYNTIAAMPTPNGSKVTGSWWYKWLFGSLHGLLNLPRLIITMFPESNVAKVLTNGNSPKQGG